MKTVKSRIKTMGFWAVIAAMALFGCSWPGPHLMHNRAVEAQFETFQVQSGYDYYTSGTLQDPRGVISLKTGYTLESPGWQPMKMTPEVLERWVVALKESPFVEENTFANGARIIGDNGQEVGNYYSVWMFPNVKVTAEKTLYVAKPIGEYRITNEWWVSPPGGDSAH